MGVGMTPAATQLYADATKMKLATRTQTRIQQSVLLLYRPFGRRNGSRPVSESCLSSKKFKPKKLRFFLQARLSAPDLLVERGAHCSFNKDTIQCTLIPANTPIRLSVHLFSALVVVHVDLVASQGQSDVSLNIIFRR